MVDPRDDEKDAVTAWLNESEGFSLRIERLHEDAASGNDLVPWLVEAFRLGADRAAPEGQVRAKIEGLIEDAMIDATVDFPAGREAGPSITWDSDKLLDDILAALTPAPDAAQTEACKTCSSFGWLTHALQRCPDCKPDAAPAPGIAEAIAALRMISSETREDNYIRGRSVYEALATCGEIADLALCALEGRK